MFLTGSSATHSNKMFEFDVCDKMHCFDIPVSDDNFVENDNRIRVELIIGHHLISPDVYELIIKVEDDDCGE